MGRDAAWGVAPGADEVKAAGAAWDVVPGAGAALVAGGVKHAGRKPNQAGWDWSDLE